MTDSDTYERMMGVWSRMVGERFLDWLAPEPGLVWTDIGCGSDAFSQLLVERCAPACLHGIDPTEARLAFARARLAASPAEFRQGDAMALPYADTSMDAAVMALVLFFIPDPARGVTEMIRVVKLGGLIAAYVWAIPDDGAPFEPIWSIMLEMGIAYPLGSSAEVSRMTALRAAWETAGIEAIETCEIRVSRSFADFATFWDITTEGPMIGDVLRTLSPEQLASLTARVRAGMPSAADGSVRYDSWCNCVKGRRAVK